MELPAGWAISTLDQVAAWGSGGTPKAGTSAYYGGGIPWAVIGDLSDGPLRETASTLTEAGIANSSAKWVPAGAVLIAMYGSIGKLGIAECSVTTNQAIAYAAPDDRVIDRKFLFWYLRSQRAELLRAGKGGAQQNISQTVLKAWPVPIPPLAEQHRIVEALEGHLSRLDAAVGLMGHARTRSRILSRSVVERAQSGNLAGPEESDDSADSLLADIAGLSEGASSMKRRKSPAFHPLSGSVSPPTHWSVRPLGDLCSLIEYGTSAKAHSEPSGGDVPVLRMGNIQNGRLDWGNLKYLSRGQDGIDKLLLNDGDILFNRTNSAELVGKAAVYRAVNGPATFASYLIRCRTWPGVDPDWVALCINSVEGRRYINSVVSQQVGQANVNGTKLSSFPIMLPPSSEQTRIVRNAEEWNDLVARAGALVAQSLKRVGHLRQSVLDRAFTGALVPQDPTDEPATALLARIQADRAAQPKAKRPRRTATAPRKPKAPAAPEPAPAPSPTPAPTHAVQQEFDL
ncbi:restriction endonuclease subunit S [Streptomyces sp. NPDC005775]|uniref:restriction endonuclease subunit S n=1 Tax=Streptomyces sp. NPDC005775 TaxID=3364729 RepID=UPI0036C9F876